MTPFAFPAAGAFAGSASIAVTGGEGTPEFMKPHLMKNWFVVQNGKQIDIHVRDKEEGREITVVANVRDEECAKLIATASNCQEEIQKAKADTWDQAIQLIEEEQKQLWRVDSPEAEATRYLVIALKRKA